MRWMILVACGMLIGCGGDEQTTTDAASFAGAQAVIDQVAAKHADLKRLTLHAVPTGKEACTQIASTMASRRGKPSDPEDLKALETGEEVKLDEGGALDLTVPIRMVDGKPTAVAGVTITHGEGADAEALVNKARAIAKELEAALQAADKPLW